MGAHERHRSAVEKEARAIESRSAAEIVVAVRKASARYREGDYLVGMVGVVLALGGLLWLPQPFALGWWLFDVAFTFVAFALASSFLPQLKRWTVSARSRESAVECAARAAFYDLGMSRTKGRSGILVFVSLLERRVVVVPDVGVIDAKPDWDHEVAALERCADDLGQFAVALRALAAPLQRALPRDSSDRDELEQEWA